MMVTVCPECGSESVSWYGTRFACKKCNMWGFREGEPCCFCKNTDMEVLPAEASCGECEWVGDPYDLMEEDNGEPDEEMSEEE